MSASSFAWYLPAMIDFKQILIARFIAALLAVTLIFNVIPTYAATFKAGRGISMDQWVTWPNESRWNDDDVLTNFPEWQQFVSDDALKTLRSDGLSTIRMPIDPAIFLHDEDQNRRETLLKNMHRAIDRILNADLNVIVDLHTIAYSADRQVIGLDQILNDDLNFVKYKALIASIAKSLSDYDAEKVALEIINEPKYDCGASDEMKIWQAQATQLHDAARKANDTITLVVPGACYASAQGLINLDPKAFGDKNIIWTFHSYDPFILTHQSADWVGRPVSAFINLPYPPSQLSSPAIRTLPDDNDRYIDRTLSGNERSNAGWYIRNELEEWGSGEDLVELLEEPFEKVAKWAARHDIAPDEIFLGEFGFIAQEYGKDFKIPSEWRIAYLKDMIALADKYQFGWSMWSFGGAFGMVQTFGGQTMPGDLIKELDLPKNN
ncbi:glycoside hydrolase family 5 protein [Ahrensia sp. 13_GOM-1096m]|uniref:glycoside hydrolase family 5 protein n=1 Tax=Ahrensia sp. 13_GOM-1096m TaxID=1380380 RepID=UPI000688C8F8|nr:cellulase family glycosylhydrolase [Ahrensia sp. 13_GOM-1096m]